MSGNERVYDSYTAPIERIWFDDLLRALHGPRRRPVRTFARRPSRRPDRWALARFPCGFLWRTSSADLFKISHESRGRARRIIIFMSVSRRHVCIIFKRAGELRPPLPRGLKYSPAHVPRHCVRKSRGRRWFARFFRTLFFRNFRPATITALPDRWITSLRHTTARHNRFPSKKVLVRLGHYFRVVLMVIIFRCSDFCYTDVRFTAVRDFCTAILTVVYTFVSSIAVMICTADTCGP